MARQRRVDEGLNALDAELARLLEVEPSADFAARVRQRVQVEPLRRGWGFVWTFASVAAVILITVGLSLVTRTTPNEGESPAVRLASPPDLPQAMQPPDAANVPQSSGADSLPAPVLRTARRREPPRAPSSRGEAVVIVDQGQRAALGLMMRLVQEGKLDSSMLATPPSSALPLETNVEVVPLTVQPLEILPIPGARTDYR